MKKMKKIISILITLCLTVSLVAGLAVSSSAAAVSGEKRTLPRVRTAPVMDGVRDELYDQGFTETLNFENAGFRASYYEDDETGEPTPPYEPASANISAVWYSNLPDDADIIGIWDTADDTQGGLYIYADVTDCTRAWGVNNTSVIDKLYLEDPSQYPYAKATPEFVISDSFWVLLDPVNYKSGTGKGLSGFAFTAYCGASGGNGEQVFPVPSWREYFYWANDMPGESGACGTLSTLITVDVKSDVRFVANEKYPFPEPPAEGADNETIVIYRSKLRRAYQYANISGYSLEMFISWSATQMDVDDPSADVNDFLYPVVGTEFGMGFQLYDNLFDYPIGTKPAFDEVQHHIFLNCGLLDFGEGEVEYWSDATYPIYFPRYVLGDYADKPIEDIIYGDANGDGGVDIEDAMLVFYHVAKKELLQDDQLAVCDTNDDGSVDIADAMKIFYFVAKKVSSVKDPEITESEAADFVSALNTTYRIADANMPIFSNSNPGDPVFFPMKDDNGAYSIPDYLYYYYVVYNEIQTAKRPTVNLNNYPDTPASELLTTAEADWIKSNSDELYFHAIEISELQGIFDSIYGKDVYKLGGTIESGYTESGYYLLPGFPGWDAGPTCKSTSVESVEVNGNKAKVTVDETWSVPLWVDGEPIPGNTVIQKTVYTVEKTDSGLRLTDALAITK